MPPSDDPWLELVVLQGSPMARWYLRDQSPVSVGSARDCDLVLDDPFVSQQHGKLALRAGRWSYVDVGSKNGSFLYRDGQVSRLAHGEPGTAIAPGDALRIGSTLIGVREGGSTPELTARGATPEITVSRPIDAASALEPTPARASLEPLSRLDEATASAEAVLDGAVQVLLGTFSEASRVLAVQLDATGARPLRHAASVRRGLRSETLGLGAPMIQRLALGNHVMLIRDDRATSSTDQLGRTCLCAPLNVADGSKGILLVERAGSATFLDADFDELARIAAKTALALSAVAMREARAREVDSQNETVMAAHDFGNGLNVVLGALGYLAETELSTGQREALFDALLAARWLTNLNRTFLDLLEMESGRLAPTIRSVVLGDEVAQCLALVRRLFDMQRVRLVTEIPPALRAQADPEFLRRVLINLLGNASRHAPENSRVTVTAVRDGGMVRVSVIDQGPGISPDVLGKMFERKVQGSRPGLLGIGLIFCRLAVERMGGRIGAESALGAGSTFWFTLGAHADVSDTERTA